MFSYATPSLFQSDLTQARLGLCCDQGRPVEWEARLIRHIPLVRFALRALGELIWSSDQDGRGALDPILTVHPDGLMAEAFSSDLTAYGRLWLSPQLYEVRGTPIWGTTNVDFSSWLWGALGEMRSSRETWLRLNPQGFSLETLGAGGRFQPKVEVPTEWFRAFLELQGALTRPCTRLRIPPMDLLAPLRFLRYSKGRLSPRALRYECHPEGWSIVLEPWEERFGLRADEGGPERVVRTWGRQRLRLIEPLLPFAEAVIIRLLGRAMPHFYQVQLPGMSFLLGLTGWGRQSFAVESGYSLLRGLPQPVEEAALVAREQELSQKLLSPYQPLDEELVRRGLALFDLERGQTRYRPLTLKPLDLSALYPADPRAEEAATLKATVQECAIQEQRKLKTLTTPQGQVQRELIFRDWKVQGECQGHPMELVVSEREQILFGRCDCAFFQKHLLSQGPCSHLLALYEASREQRGQNLPSSLEVQEVPPRQEVGEDGEE